MDDTGDAVQQVAESLGTEVYELVPDGDYFLGPEMLMGLAGLLVGAFCEGLRAAAKGEVETWGQKAGEALAARIRRFLRDGEPVPPPPDPPRDADPAVVQPVFVFVLGQAGMSDADAERVSATVRTALGALPTP